MNVLEFFKNNAVAVIPFICAFITMFFVPPNANYFNYIDYNTLLLLFSLMVVIGAVESSDYLKYLSYIATKHGKDSFRLLTGLVLLCFFTSMFLTNDVVLLAFVPFTVYLMKTTGLKDKLIYVIVLETIAANIGSAFTPIGNPQNIYIYYFYRYNIHDFLSTTFPLTFISLILILILCVICFGKKIKIDEINQNETYDKKEFVFGMFLLIIVLLSIIKVISPILCFVLTAASALIYNSKYIQSVDYGLLFTFVCFFIFSGNMENMIFIKEIISRFLEGNELIFSAATSQIISNVPAAILLSKFTNRQDQLLLGVNIGGLGTPVASLASIISLNIYMRSEKEIKKYITIFTIFNALFLIILIFLFNYII